MVRFLSLFLLVMLFLPNGLLAQPGTWHSYPIPSRVNDYMEYEGQLWAATDAGIFLMDPATGQVNGHLTKANSGLPSNEIEALAIHPQTLQPFIGTYDVALAFRTPDGLWQRMEYPPAVIAQVQNNKVLTYCIEFDAQGRLWVGTNAGLLRYDNGAWTVFSQTGGNSFLRDVWSMAIDESGAVLAASNLLYRVENDVPQLFSPAPGGPFGFELFSYSDAKVFAASNGDVWFFTDIGRIGRRHNGVWEIFSPQQQPELMHRGPLFVNELPNGNLSAFYKENSSFFLFDGEDWALAETQPAETIIGAYRNEDSDLLFTKSRVLAPSQGDTASHALYDYPINSVPGVYRTDAQRQLWTSEDNFILRNLGAGDTLQCRYNGQPFWAGSFTLGPQGDVWVASGFNLYHRVPGGEWTLFNHTNAPLPQASITRIIADELGRLWVYIYNKGLFRYDGQDWKQYTHALFASQYVYTMTPGAGGAIWFSSYANNQGYTIGRFDGVQMQTFSAANSGFNMDYALGMAFDAQSNRLWVVGNADRAQYYDGNVWHTETFPAPAAAGEWVMQIQARDGAAVLASSSRVLIYSNGQWQEFNRQNSPLSNGAIYAMALDADNALWISHNQPSGIDIYETGLLSTRTRDEAAPHSPALSVYPNPAGDVVSIGFECNEDASPAHLRIFSADGRLLSTHQEALQPGACQIAFNAAHLMPGVYFVQMERGKKRLMGRFVKG